MDRIYISTKDFPLSDEQRALFEEIVKNGTRKAGLVWKAPDEMTNEDFEQAAATIHFYPPERYSVCKKLEWVQLTSAGANMFTGPGILPENVTLTNASGAYSLTVGEHMLAMTFDLVRHLGEYRVNQTRHVWDYRGSVQSVEGSTVVVLGMGDIGGFYARKMNALGAHVIGVRKHLKEKPDYLDEQVTMDRLAEVLPKADIVAMVLPGGKETEHIIGEKEFALMKEGSMILNVGRGNAIDPEALRNALDSGHIRAAALDVTEPEPLPADDPLWDYENVLITPHAAGWWFLQETLNRAAAICAENLRCFVNGEPLTHVVDRKLGY